MGFGLNIGKNMCEVCTNAEKVGNTNLKISFVDLSYSETGKTILKGLQDREHQDDLDLSKCNFKDTEFQYMSECKFLGSLRKLNLSENYFGSDGIPMFALNNYMVNLQELNLSSNKIEDAGLKEFIDCKFLHNLEKLELQNNRIHPRGIRHFSECNFLSNLK